MQISLTTAVNAFKNWASGYPVDERSGEWECDYAQWPHMHEAFLNHLNTCLPASAPPGDMADLLYALGRDNESGYLAKALARHKDWFLLLLPHALRDDDADVRWQFALQLGPGCQNTFLRPRQMAENSCWVTLSNLRMARQAPSARMAATSQAAAGATAPRRAVHGIWPETGRLLATE